MKIHESNRYQRAFKVFVRRSKKKAEILKKTLTFLKENPRYPGLHTEKLKNSNVWTCRLDQDNRLFFMWQDQKVILIDVGRHDKYRQY